MAVRNANYDYARLVAALVIVVFHLTGSAVAHTALPFFVMLLAILAAPGPEGFGTFARRRARRLLVPWLAWSAFYGALKLLDGDRLTPDMLLYGPAIHLWFLPFAFVVSCIAWATRSPWQVAGLGALVMVPLLLLQPAWVPAAQWAEAFPAVVIALALLVAPMALTALAVVVATVLGGSQFLAALAGILLCRAFALPPTRLSAWCAGVAFPVYLVHPFVAAVLARTLAGWGTPLHVVLTCLLSVAAAEGLRRVAIALRRAGRPPTPPRAGGGAMGASPA